jgi:hypothetical protein
MNAAEHRKPDGETRRNLPPAIDESYSYRQSDLTI